MEDVKVWLSYNGLGEYWQNFEKHGWEELWLLTEMSEVDLEMCITKRGHRAKFRKALRPLTNASASSGNSESPSHADERQNFSCEVGPMPLESTDHPTPSLLQMADTTTKLERTESNCSIQVEDRTEPIETVWKIDKAGTDQIDAVREVDNTGSDPIDAVQEIDNADSVAKAQDMKAVLRIAKDNRTETEPDVTITTRNEVSRFEESRIASSTRNDLPLSSELDASELETMVPSYTVIDDRVLEGPSPHGLEREPPNITVIGHSENTTVYQGPTQQLVTPEDDSNNPVVILKGQMEMLADSYRNKDYLYVETKAFQELKSVVEEMHWATLLGKPGDGKSATAVHLLLQYIEKGYEPVFLSSPRDWKMLISDSSSSRQIAVVDDMFGQSILDDNKNVGKWKSLIESMSRIVEQRKGNLLVICTSRRYIFKDIENALNKFVCFSKHAIVDMTDEKYKLSGDEKLAIFKQFAETYSIENSVWLEGNIRYVDPPHGFPHCVELYCRNVFLRIEGIAFFRNPVQYVQREIFNFRDNDRVKFLVLLLVLHNGDKLGLDTLDKLIEKTTDDDKILFQTAGVSLETAFPDVHRALTGLTNTYIKQNNDGSYSFSHHSLRETVADIYITANPSHAIRALEFQHIVAFTCTQNETAKGTVSKRSLPFEPLAKRMITEIKDGHVSTVCDCEVWSDQTFVIQFVKSIENEPLDFLEELICSKRTETRITESSGFLISLIQRKRFIAAKTFLENKSIGKALQNIDLWVKSLQEGLERAVYPSPSNPKIAMIRTLGSIRCGENMQKLDGSKLLSFMLLWSEVAIAKLDHTHINPQYGQPDTMSQYFHALAVQQFEVLCKKLLQAEVAVALLDHTHINPQYSQPGFLSQYFYVLANSTIDLPQFEVLCKKLLQAGADINQTDWNDVPAVFNCLTRFEDKGFDRLLCMVNNGADIHKRCKHGNIVLFTINRFNLRYILPRYYTPPPINNEPWSSKCVNILSKLSDLDVDFHCTDRAGSNALHIMCQRRPDEDSHVLLDYLLNKGVAAGAANKDGVVPLMLALKNNFSTDIIKTLAKNSPPNYVDKSGQNYFHYLFSSDCITNADEFCDKCDILIELGSSIGAKDNSDKPPIVHLMERYHNFYGGFDFVRMFHFFNEHGVDLHVKDGLGRNIVLCVLDWKITETESVYGLKHNFIQQINKPVTDQVSLLRFFQSIGLDLKLIDSNGRNALHHLFANILYNDKVIRNGDFYNTTKREFPEVSGNILKEIYDFLTEEIGLLPTTRNKNGKNAVMLALKNCAGFSWIIDLLNLEFPLHEDNKGRNYLHYLVKSRAPDCKFEALKTALSDKGLTVDDQILKNRPKQILD